MEEQLYKITQALRKLRAPFLTEEYDLHALAAEALSSAGIPFLHEVMVAPRCRIDFLAGTVGIEVKKGKPEKIKLIRQLNRYALSPKIEALVVLVERSAALPGEFSGKPCVMLSANRMWGIAL